ncbi:MAG TPA: hypothetical protein PKD78_02370, partial [Saprospiraceae bacterium]|nr:hypothetical protein [Saprospiraceae bacterium]
QEQEQERKYSHSVSNLLGWLLDGIGEVLMISADMGARQFAFVGQGLSPLPFGPRKVGFAHIPSLLSSDVLRRTLKGGSWGRQGYWEHYNQKGFSPASFLFGRRESD